ncbi:CBS domain-containing protein [Nonomuraea sp. PA05]|uniref:CBS domain-containing protein n=1 Tax=Nonomuraea sp. PA05 TaxID=2604466 RepID=UPI0021CC5F7D
MTSKVVSVLAATPFKDIAGGISAVPGLDDDHVIGMVSEAEGDTAAELMTSPAITITPAAAAVQAVRLMDERDVKRLAVVDHDGRLQCCEAAGVRGRPPRRKPLSMRTRARSRRWAASIPGWRAVLPRHAAVPTATFLCRPPQPSS